MNNKLSGFLKQAGGLGLVLLPCAVFWLKTKWQQWQQGAMKEQLEGEWCELATELARICRLVLAMRPSDSDAWKCLNHAWVLVPKDIVASSLTLGGNGDTINRKTARLLDLEDLAVLVRLPEPLTYTNKQYELELGKIDTAFGLVYRAEYLARGNLSGQIMDQLRQATQRM